MTQREGWTAKWAVEREQRIAHLARLPGNAHHERLEAINRVSRLLSTNGAELSRQIATFVGTGRHVQDLTDDFEHEAVRFLHNYIASVATLRDVQRSTHRMIWPERIPVDQRRDSLDRRTVWEVSTYEPKVTELFGDDDIKFLFDLRNFTVHYSAPVMSIGTTWRHRPPGPVEWINTVQLKRSELDKFSNWSGPAKRFLRTHKNDVEFLPLIEKYSQRAREFYEWFWFEVRQAVTVEVEEFLSKSNEFRLWLGEEMAQPDFDPAPGGTPIPGSFHRNRARAHLERSAYGTTGWGGITVGVDGTAVVGDSDWDPLPQVGKYRRPGE